MLVQIKTRKLEYKFEIFEKYNIILGESGIGKTTLYELVAAGKSVSNIICDKQLVALPTNAINYHLEDYNDCIIFMDENCGLLRKHGFEKELKNSNNYFVIISRKLNFDSLPISTNAIYDMKSSGKFHTLVHKYNEFNMNIQDIDCIITEDKKSGYQFIKEVVQLYNIQNHIDIVHADGNSKIISKMQDCYNNNKRNFVIVYDSSDFGTKISLLLKFMQQYNKCNYFIIDWVSFENYILASKMFNIKIDYTNMSYKYESLEQYSTAVLSNIIQGYDKSRLPKCLKFDRCYGCNRGSYCKFCNRSFYELIYSKVDTLVKYLSTKYELVRVDLTYNQFIKAAKNGIDKDKVTIQNVDFSNNRCTINGRSISITKIVSSIKFGTNKVRLSNPSILRDWKGFRKG